MDIVAESSRNLNRDTDENPVIVNQQVDWREQLFNDGETGPVERVSTPETMVTSLRGIMLDIEAKLIRQDRYANGNGTPAERLYDQLARAWLANDPILARAEVRCSGSGLHVLLRFENPIAFHHEGQRQRWSGIVRAVQCILPSDPRAPNLNALTRPVGSTNSKNNQTVTVFQPGTGVTAGDVLGLYERLQKKPFATVADVLFGSGRITPCPVCRRPGSSLGAFERFGHCYGHCGKIQLPQLIATLMVDTNCQEA